MVIDVKPLLRGDVRKIPLDYYITLEKIPRVRFEGDAHAVGEITDNGGYMRLVLKISAEYVAECARCLEDVRGIFEEDFERTVVTKGSIDNERLEESVDEYAVLSEDGELNIDDEIADTMLLLFPKKILCSESCEGLCPKCGKPKKLGDCGCVTKEIDPRLAVLKQLLDKKED